MYLSNDLKTRDCWRLSRTDSKLGEARDQWSVDSLLAMVKQDVESRKKVVIIHEHVVNNKSTSDDFPQSLECCSRFKDMF